MAPPAVGLEPALNPEERSQSFEDSPRAAKRLKSADDRPVSHTRRAQGDSAIVRSHPLGIKPSGNAYTASVDLKGAAGSFGSLPDELLLQLLELFQAPELVAIGATCKALYAFSRAEELWRSLFVE